MRPHSAVGGRTPAPTKLRPDVSKMANPTVVDNWINDGTKGIDAAANIKLPEVDFMTLHVYAPNWGFAADKYHWLLQNFVADRAALAAVANKPIVLEVRWERKRERKERRGWTLFPP